MVDIARSTLESYGFPVTNVTSDLIQTDWRNETASDDLRMLGVQQVRDRAEVFIRSRGNDYFTGSARFTYEALIEGEGWRAIDIPEASRAQYERLRVTAEERLSRFMNQN